MSDTRSPALGAPSRGSTPRRTGPTRWVGLVVFAGCLMLLLGFFQAIAGLAAIVNDDYYETAPDRLLVVHDYTVWGWVHLLLGVLIFLAGIGVMSGNVLARAVGVVLAVCSAVLALAFLPAQPIWSLIVVAVDVLVIYALVVHGREAGQG